MPEKGTGGLEEAVRELAEALGVVRVHQLRSEGTHPGFPDDVLIGARGVLWRELKREGGRVTPAQALMHEQLRAAGQDVAVWRPRDLLSGRIARELRQLGPTPVTAPVPPPHLRQSRRAR